MNESTFIPHKRIDIMIPILSVEMYDSAEKKDELSRNKCYVQNKQFLKCKQKEGVYNEYQFNNCLFGNNFITH